MFLIVCVLIIGCLLSRKMLCLSASLCNNHNIYCAYFGIS